MLGGAFSRHATWVRCQLVVKHWRDNERPMLSGLLLFIPAFFAISALCAGLQRRRAARRNGWHTLTPGPWLWLGLACGLLLTAVFTLVAMSASSTPGLIGLAVFFNVLTGAIVYTTLTEDVRWNDDWIERRTLTFEIRRMGWAELAYRGYEASGYRWISSQDGEWIRYQDSCNGVDELEAMIRRHWRSGGPPQVTEPEPIVQLVAQPR